MPDSTFRQSPNEIITIDKIEYLFYDYYVTWEEARIICLGYDSQLATLDTEQKATSLTRMTSESSLASEEYWIGSKMSPRGYWIWVANNEKIAPYQFLQEMIVIPRYADKSLENDVYCLTIFRKSHYEPMFTPLRCQKKRSFICQRAKVPDEDSISNIFSTKIGEDDFILFSGKLTWLEAAIQCRQRGLQIAEVTTLNQAQTLATGMLRIRPRAIENAWIGGYMKEHTWKWLSSGYDVPYNEMWPNETMDSGECLLLDRHICNLPSYVSTKCDRKRNFWCQTCVEKTSTEKFMDVTVDSCEYALGLYPLNWSQALRACESINTTLVTLDSPETLKHIIHIMIDNREQFHHIWVNGKRQLINQEKYKRQIKDEIWQWEGNGKRIPGPGESFIPWCYDCQYHKNEADCLNLDRENFNVPLVYGLDCNNEQKFICQKWTEKCNEMKGFDLVMTTMHSKNKYKKIDEKNPETESNLMQVKEFHDDSTVPNQISSTEVSAELSSVTKTTLQSEASTKSAPLTTTTSSPEVFLETMPLTTTTSSPEVFLETMHLTTTTSSPEVLLETMPLTTTTSSLEVLLETMPLTTIASSPEVFFETMPLVTSTLQPEDSSKTTLLITSIRPEQISAETVPSMTPSSKIFTKVIPSTTSIPLEVSTEITSPTTSILPTEVFIKTTSLITSTLLEEVSSETTLVTTLTSPSEVLTEILPDTTTISPLEVSSNTAPPTTITSPITFSEETTPLVTSTSQPEVFTKTDSLTSTSPLEILMKTELPTTTINRRSDNIKTSRIADDTPTEVETSSTTASSFITSHSFDFNVTKTKFKSDANVERTNVISSTAPEPVTITVTLKNNYYKEGNFKNVENNSSIGANLPPRKEPLPEVLGFRDLIEFMLKNINKNRTRMLELSQIMNDANKTSETTAIKSNVSKILNLSLNKKRIFSNSTSTNSYLSATTVSSLTKNKSNKNSSKTHDLDNFSYPGEHISADTRNNQSSKESTSNQDKSKTKANNQDAMFSFDNNFFKNMSNFNYNKNIDNDANSSHSSEFSHKHNNDSTRSVKIENLSLDDRNNIETENSTLEPKRNKSSNSNWKSKKNRGRNHSSDQNEPTYKDVIPPVSSEDKQSFPDNQNSKNRGIIGMSDILKVLKKNYQEMYPNKRVSFEVSNKMPLKRKKKDAKMTYD